MTEQTPAQRLIAAAERLRQLAAAATPGPWVCLDGGDRIIRDPDATAREDTSDPCGAGPPLEYVVDEPLYAHPENGPYIAAMHPGVAIAIADLLEAEAVTWESAETAAAQINAEWKPDWHVEPPVDPEKIAGAGAKLALAVADLVLAGGTA